MQLRKPRPYLLSVGFGIPRLAFWWHGYFDVRRKRKHGSASLLCFRTVWACYRKTELPPPDLTA